MAATALNNVLMTAGVIESVHLFEYSFALLALVATYYNHTRLAQKSTTSWSGRSRPMPPSSSSRWPRGTEGERRFRNLASATAEGVILLADERVVSCSPRNRAAHRQPAGRADRPAGDRAVATPPTATPWPG